MKRLVVPIGILAFILFFYGLGSRDFWAPDEGDFAQVIRELDHDLVIPHLNNKPYAEKPPLFYYAGYISKKAFCFLPDEQSTRFVSALTAFLATLFFAVTVFRMQGSKSAFISSLMLITSPLFYWQARYLQVDMLFASFLIISLLSFLHYNTTRSRAMLYLSALCLGCAFLAKGPIAVVLAMPIIAIHLFFEKELGFFGKKEFFFASGIFVAVVVPWYIVVFIRENPTFLYENIVRQNLLRFVEAWSHKRPIYYYFTTLPLDFFPWSLFLPMGFVLALRQWKENQTVRFFLVWFGWTFLFLSLSSGKISKYMLPALPSACVVASLPLLESSRKYNSAVFLFLSAVFLALSGLLVFYGRIHYPDFYREQILMAGIAFVLSVTLVWSTVRHCHFGSFIALVVAFSLIFMVGNTSVYAKLNRYKSPRLLCTKIKHYLEDGSSWVYYGSMRGVYVYYVGKPAIAIDEHRATELRDIAGRLDRFYVLTRKRDVAEVYQALGNVEQVLEEKVGDTSMVFVRYARQ